MNQEIHPIANFFEFERDHSRRLNGPRISPRSGPYGKTHKCPECGSLVRTNEWHEATGTAEGRNVQAWLDYAGTPHLVFSQRVVDGLNKIKATGFAAHPLPIKITQNLSMWSKWLEDHEPPSYYWLEVTGRVNIDRNIYDGGDGNLCSICLNWRPRKGGKVTYGDMPSWPIVESWDGSDFVMTRNVKSGLTYCTRRILELTISEEWTGFDFRSFMPRMPLGNYREAGWFERYNAELHRRIPWPQDEIPWWEKEKKAACGGS